MHKLLQAQDIRKVPRCDGISVNKSGHFENDKNEKQKRKRKLNDVLRTRKGWHERLFDEVKYKKKRS